MDNTAQPAGVTGVGVDLEQIGRIQAIMEKSRFLERFFGEDERAMLAARGNPPQSVAANYCAKEAFAKALGTGVRDFALHEVQVLRDSLGKPFFQLEGAALRLVEARGLSLSLSLSHSGEFAVAFVVASQAGRD